MRKILLETKDEKTCGLTGFGKMHLDTMKSCPLSCLMIIKDEQKKLQQLWGHDCKSSVI